MEVYTFTFLPFKDVIVHLRFLKLFNGLKVLLVSDVATEKAAAALAVRVGEL